MRERVTVDGAVRSETECRTVAAESGGRGQTEMYESGERSQLLKAHKFTEDAPAPRPPRRVTCNVGSWRQRRGLTLSLPDSVFGFCVALRVPRLPWSRLVAVLVNERVTTPTATFASTAARMPRSTSSSLVAGRWSLLRARRADPVRHPAAKATEEGCRCWRTAQPPCPAVDAD